MAEGATKHTILGGKVHVYRRENSGQWQCSTYLDGKNYRVSTKTDSLAQAKSFAEDWFLTLRGKAGRGELRAEKTFKDAAAVFEQEYEAITEGERSPAYVRGHKDRIRLHLNPYFGAMALPAVTAGVVAQYRAHRRSSKTPPARSTLHHEIVTLRQVLKTALRHEWITHLPDLTAPYRGSGKVSHRAWFSPEEYKTLYTATRDRSKDKDNHRRGAALHLHDYVLFMANTGLRPDEAARLQWRDVEVVDDKDSGERILVISVRGKRGVGYCKSTANAVRPFERLRQRATTKAQEAAKAKREKEGLTEKDLPPPKAPGAAELLFPSRQTMLFNKVLADTNLKRDRDEQVRTAYSLRHTYICMRLMEGADIYQVAKNCRTSVEMIEKFYASHIANQLSAAAINVRRARQLDPRDGK